MKNFEYLEPRSVAEASQQMRDCGDDAMLIAGGTALLLALRHGLAQPSHLISLQHVAGLDGIAYSASDGLHIGARTCHADLESSPVIREHYPFLARMAGQVASPQIRHRGTIGGNLCYGDPASDPPAALLALDAQVKLESDAGARVLPLSEFLIGYYETAITPGELLTDIRIPPPTGRCGAAYIRHTLTGAEERPFLGIAARLTLIADGVADGTCAEARLAVSAISPVAQRLTRAEAVLTGQPLTEEAFAAAAEAAADEVTPISDYKASQDYRRHIVGVMVKRILRQAAAQV